MFRIISLVIMFIILFNSNSVAFAEKAGNSYNLKFEYKQNFINNNTFISLDNVSIKKNTDISGSWIGSFFITGLGQMLLGEIPRGLLFFGGFVLSVLLMLLSNSNALLGSGEEGMIFGMLIGFVSAVTIYIWNIFDSYNLALNKSQQSIIPVNSTFHGNYKKDNYLSNNFEDNKMNISFLNYSLKF